MVRVIHVPGTGGGGVSKPVVVMTTGLSKSTVGGVLPVPSGASLTKATSQVGCLICLLSMQPWTQRNQHTIIMIIIILN